MNILRYVILSGLLGLVLVSQSGCLVAAAAAGAGATVAYVKGEEESLLQGTPEQVTAAGAAAIEDLKLLLVSHQANAIEGKVIARTLSDKEVKIDIKAEGAALSRVTVRVGYFGDEAISLQILEKTKAHLPASRPATQPTL